MYVNTKINSTAHNERQSLNLVNNVFFLSIIIVGVSAVRTERLFGKAEAKRKRAKTQEINMSP
jgi:hypothetical protein